uniref:Uncharacterized protein n=1 Tax=Taeniopygia guttata TaxID=59729 RepID=A0A674HKY4_TAEGU
MIHSGNSSQLSLATKALFQVGSPCNKTRLPTHAAWREKLLLWSIRNMTKRRIPEMSLTFWEGERQKRKGSWMPLCSSVMGKPLERQEILEALPLEKACRQ